MADITMCDGTGCLKKDDCYRHTATPNKWRQSYFIEVPVETKKSGKQVCTHHLIKEHGNYNS